MQYGIRAANYPFIADDMDNLVLPASLKPLQHKMFGNHQSGASGGDPRRAPGEQPLCLDAPVPDGSDRSGGAVSQE
jgi:hypothetical protein